MSTSATVSADEFQALEQKVLRAVEVVRREREARAAAEAEVARLREDVARLEDEGNHLREDRERLQVEHATAAETAAGELQAMRDEREHVRQRVEAMLSQMDELL